METTIIEQEYHRPQAAIAADVKLACQHSPAYAAIVAAANKLGWPTHFRTDLTVVDRLAIADHAGESFVWGIRSTGTDLIFANAFDLDWMRACIKNGRNIWYDWDGNRLREISPTRAIEIVERRIKELGQ